MRETAMAGYPLSRLRVLSRHSGLQARLAEAVRAAVGVRRIGHRQSDTLKKVIGGSTPLCDRLECVLDELISSGAEDADITAVLGMLACDVRAKLAARRGEPTPDYLAAHIAEMGAEGEANAAQVAACAEKTPSALRRLIDKVYRHRERLEQLAHAARAELAKAEGGVRQWTR